MGQNKKKKKHNQTKTEVSVNVEVPKGISPEEMQHVIAKAIVEADEIKEKHEIRKEEERQENWHKTLGIFAYSGDNWIKKKACNFADFFIILWKVLFNQKKLVDGNRATFALLKLALNGFFCIPQLYFLLAIGAYLFSIGLQIFEMEYPTLLISLSSIMLFQINNNWIVLVFSALISFFFFRMISLAVKEIDKMRDSNLLFGVFASVTALVSLVIAVVSLIVTINQGG